MTAMQADRRMGAGGMVGISPCRTSGTRRPPAPDHGPCGRLALEAG
ncbi:MAG: hypothetical protein ACOYXN_05780 [Acidobacteriota bacterium]